MGYHGEKLFNVNQIFYQHDIEYINCSIKVE